jgi:hypothetical protein
MRAANHFPRGPRQPACPQDYVAFHDVKTYSSLTELAVELIPPNEKKVSLRTHYSYRGARRDRLPVSLLLVPQAMVFMVPMHHIKNPDGTPLSQLPRVRQSVRRSIGSQHCAA